MGQHFLMLNYTILITFDDNSSFKFYVTPHLDGEIYQPIRDQEYFQKVKVDEVSGTICWPNGADFDTEVLYYEEMKAQVEDELKGRV